MPLFLGTRSTAIQLSAPTCSVRIWVRMHIRHSRAFDTCCCHVSPRADSKNARALQAAVADITELLPGEAVMALERDVDSLQ